MRFSPCLCDIHFQDMDYFRPGVVEVETAFMSLAVPAMINPDRIFELVAVVRCVCVCACVWVCARVRVRVRVA